ncbi:YbfB/YjiJ family MFS transporter [Breoghania sp. L-A4]|uniref:YbfB/YjiJ family MFS transporter n=1 Tax=Breoghania sp. L-A4 TaxID=2304600 RepID=UPI000E35FB54|nr:YbfB/YjiJ family MFS transporter [Breoghania sp. L-A4]AXS39908.1 YbfB/YjiJ family MFS transporter [Breoghania sp. L-A4]
MTQYAPPQASPLSATLPVALGGLLAMAACMGIGRFVYTPILPFMVAEAGLTPAQGGIIASANFLAYLIGALAAASTRLTDALPMSRRTLFLSALALSAATTAGMGLTDDVSVFIILRFLSGLASAYAMVFSTALVLDRLAAAGRPGLVSLHFAGVGAGIAGSAMLVAALDAAGADWRQLWFASGVASAVLLALVARLIGGGADPGAAPAQPGAPAGRRLVALYVSYGLFGFGYSITATFINTLARLSPTLSDVEPVIWTAVGLAGIPSIAAWVALGKRIGNQRAYAAACVVETLGVTLSVTSDSGWVVVLAAMMLGGTFIAITAVGLMHARSLSRGDPRTALALMTAAFGLGQMAGPTVAGLGFEATGSFLLPSLSAAAALVVAAALALTPARRTV